MTTLYEAITKISSESLYTKSQRNISQKILKNYITNLDEYGDYLTKEEYQAFQHSLSPEYAGVGIILYQEKSSDAILCIPTKNHIQERGVSQYDQLISVNGQSVVGKNFYLVGSWIRGKKNSSVRLELKKASGQIKTVTLKRTEQNFVSTLKVCENGVAMIQIVRFTKETPAELDDILRQWPKNIPIVIDLRGNGGGDFFSAIQSANLLLPKDALITTLKTKEKAINYNASDKDYYIKERSVILLQDKLTASAAEVFITAITQNNRGKSIGSKSYGKGVAQKFIPLSNGDALLLTYGEIITPNGQSYHQNGLQPTSLLLLDEILSKTYDENPQTNTN